MSYQQVIHFNAVLAAHFAEQDRHGVYATPEQRCQIVRILKGVNGILRRSRIPAAGMHIDGVGLEHVLQLRAQHIQNVDRMLSHPFYCIDNTRGRRSLSILKELPLIRERNVPAAEPGEQRPQRRRRLVGAFDDVMRVENDAIAPGWLDRPIRRQLHFAFHQQAPAVIHQETEEDMDDSSLEDDMAIEAAPAA